MIARAPHPPRRLSAASLIAGAVAALALASGAWAGFTYSGVVSIAVPATADGIFINFSNGQFGTGRDSVKEWDINIFGATGLQFASAKGGGFMSAAGSDPLLVDNLAFMTQIGSATPFAQGPLGIETSGSTAFNASSSQNLIGFRFMGTSGAFHYGWMRMQVGRLDSSEPRAIFEYLVSTTPGEWVNAGVIPAPGALAGIAAAGSLLVPRRRR